MKFIITGHKGFIGQALIESLKQVGKSFVVLNEPDISDQNYFDGIETEPGDVLIHLANRSSVPDSWEQPYEFIHSNTHSTLKAAEFCRKNDLGLIYLSSYMYGNPSYFPVDENHEIQTLSPYAFSKKASEELIQFYGDKFNLKYTILRPFNIYGAGQKSNFIIPILIDKFNDPQIDQISMNDLKPKRDFVHVKDLVRAILLCSNQLNNRIYNVSSGVSYSILELATLIKELMGSKKEIIDLNISRQNEILDCYGSFERIRKEIGWTPQIDLKSGIKEILENEFKR